MHELIYKEARYGLKEGHVNQHCLVGQACAYKGIVAAIFIFEEICPSVFAAAQEYKS